MRGNVAAQPTPMAVGYSGLLCSTVKLPFSQTDDSFAATHIPLEIDGSFEALLQRGLCHPAQLSDVTAEVAFNPIHESLWIYYCGLQLPFRVELTILFGPRDEKCFWARFAEVNSIPKDSFMRKTTPHKFVQSRGKRLMHEIWAGELSENRLKSPYEELARSPFTVDSGQVDFNRLHI